MKTHRYMILFAAATLSGSGLLAEDFYVKGLRVRPESREVTRVDFNQCLNEGDIGACSFIIRAFNASGQLHRGSRFIQQACSLGAKACLQAGQVYDGVNQAADAERYYKLACEQDAESCNGLARFLEKRGRKAEAAQAFDAVCSARGGVACTNALELRGQMPKDEEAYMRRLEQASKEDDAYHAKKEEEWWTKANQSRQSSDQRPGSAETVSNTLDQLMQRQGPRSSSGGYSSEAKGANSLSGACAACDSDAELLRLKRSAENGSMRDTYLAAARLCECKLQAGGCGSSRSVLQKMINDNRAEAAKLQSNAPAVSR